MHAPDFDVLVASGTDPAVAAAQQLRYDVFIDELGGDGPMVDHDSRREIDGFDRYSKHMLLLDRARGAQLGEQVVGVYRLMDSKSAASAGAFYSEREYDLSKLRGCGKSLLELGRSCLHRDYRGGLAMYEMWSALSRYIAQVHSDVLFGTASFHGTDTAAIAPALSLLHHRHLAPSELRVEARAPFSRMDLIAPEDLDRRAAMLQVPALIKAYLRLGGCVGQGAFLDHEFNTTDVCLILDVARMNIKQHNLYAQERQT